jgi:hypothetical protein
MALTDKGEKIFESFGDYGATIEEAVNNNFQNFSASSLHPLLAALGCIDPHAYDQITIEEWKINGKVWRAYIGNLKHDDTEELDILKLVKDYVFQNKILAAEIGGSINSVYKDLSN